VLLSPFHILRTYASIVLSVGYKRSCNASESLLSKLLAHLAYGSAGVQPRAVVVAGNGVLYGNPAGVVSLSRSLELVQLSALFRLPRRAVVDWYGALLLHLNVGALVNEDFERVVVVR